MPSVTRTILLAATTGEWTAEAERAMIMAEHAPALFRACLSASAAVEFLPLSVRRRMPDALVKEVQDVFRAVNDILMQTYRLDHVPGCASVPGSSYAVRAG